MSTYNFVKFEGVSSRNLDSFISIRNGSVLGLSAGFCKMNNLDRYRFVVLFLDSKKKSLGLKFTNSETEKSKFSLSKAGEARSLRIMARSFFNSSPLPMQKYVNKIYIPKQISMREGGINSEGVMFVIDLERPA